MADESIEVIEVDQWSQTGDIHDYSFDELKAAIEACDDNQVPKIEGGDAEAARKIFGGKFKVKTVDPADRPLKGYVWFREADDGSLEEHAYNYATK